MYKEIVITVSLYLRSQKAWCVCSLDYNNDQRYSSDIFVKYNLHCTF